MVTALLLLCCGILEGSTSRTGVYILPQSGHIATFKFGVPNITFSSLEGKNLVSFSTAPGVPIQVCEGLGYIFVTCETANNVMNLLVYDNGLKRKWTIRNSSLYYANVLDGKLFGLNLESKLSHPTRFPFLATEFDVKTKTYTTNSFFKLPEDLHRYNTTPPPYWIFRLGNVCLALTMNSSSAYLIDEKYLESEKYSTSGVPTQIQKIPLDVPEGFKNQGEMKVDRVMTIEEFRPLRLKWLAEKTYISTAWQREKEIYFCYREHASNKTHIAKLDSLLIVKHLQTVDGLVKAGEGDRYWVLIETQSGWNVDVHILP